MYTDLPPGRLTDLRAAAVNNENFACVAVKHNLHLHLRHGSSALEKQIRDFVKEGESELSNPGFNSFVKLRKFLVTLLNLLLVLSSWIVDGTHQLCGRYSNPCCNQW